jgi:hypothetical protein
MNGRILKRGWPDDSYPKRKIYVSKSVRYTDVPAALLRRKVISFFFWLLRTVVDFSVGIAAGTTDDI